MFEVTITSFHTSPKSFREAQYGFVDRVLRQLVPYQLQNFLELIDILRLGLKWLAAFKHSSPDMVVQSVEVRRVRTPFIFTNKFTAVGSNPVLSQLCRVCRRAILLKDEARWQNRSAILNKFRQQAFNIKFNIHFGLVWNEMQSSLPTETDARRNHDVFGKLCSLSYQTTFINVSLITLQSAVQTFSDSISNIQAISGFRIELDLIQGLRMTIPRFQRVVKQ